MFAFYFARIDKKCFSDLEIFQIFVELIQVFIVEKVFVDGIGYIVGDSCSSLWRFNFLGLVSSWNVKENVFKCYIVWVWLPLHFPTMGGSVNFTLAPITVNSLGQPVMRGITKAAKKWEGFFLRNCTLATIHIFHSQRVLLGKCQI